MDLKIEYVSKEELIPYANNAKVHTAEQIEQIKKSIELFGFNDPIAVWRDNEIVEGHGRLLAVMEMENIQTVPIIRLDELTEEQKKIYALVHNKLTMNTDFNIELLRLELDEILDVDMSDFGFDLDEEELPDFDNIESTDDDDGIIEVVVKIYAHQRDDLEALLKEKEYKYEVKE